MSTVASSAYSRGYADGGEDARDEIVSVFFDLIGDARQVSLMNQGYSGTWAADYIYNRLNTYIDEHRGVWANV